MAELRTLQGHALLLPDGRITVGADLANEVPVAAHFGLAPVHFRLQPWEGGHFIEDAGSGLGTLVNGHPVNWKPLLHGDIITAGDLEVSYFMENCPVLTPEIPTGPGTVPQPGPVIPLPVLDARPWPVRSQPAPLPALPEQSWHPPVDVPPPAWLPEDLLPEAYRSAAARADAPPQISQRSAQPAAPPRPVQRSILPLAAAIALLATAGLAARQYHVSSRSLPSPLPTTATSPKLAPLSAPAPIPVPSHDAIEEIRRPLDQ